MLMHNASLTSGAYFQVLPSQAFNFGAGDFSVGAMVVTTAGGPVVSRLGPSGAGFGLFIGADSSITFKTADGAGNWQVQSGATAALDGGCHSLLAVRQGATMRILLDGAPLPVTGSGTRPSPLNVSNSQPLLIGSSRSGHSPAQLVGTVMNVGVWSAALAGDRIVSAAFARVMATDPGLQGYWTLDLTTDDVSPNGNPASIVGPVRFKPCVDCVFTTGANDYGFCQMANTPTASQRADADLLAAEPITQVRHVNVKPGTPALFASVMPATDAPAFPAGTAVTITDPSGRRYNADVNTDNVFIVTRDGQPWGVSVMNPQPGPWQLSVSAPPAVGFVLQMQTCPPTEVVSTITSALLPLYGPQAAGGAWTADEPGDEPGALGGWLSILTKVAVAAVVGVAVAGAIVVSGGTALPAVIAGVVAFAGVGLAEAAASLPSLNTGSLAAATAQVGGVAGFLVAPDGLLLVDANADHANQLQYKRRREVLYPYVTLSTFNKKQQQLVGPDDTRAKVSARLKSFGPGFASMAGHGEARYLTGWFEKGNSGPAQEVLTRGSYDPAEVRSKIIHLFACLCGYAGSIGLGRDVVSKGAVAFFGYYDKYIIPEADYQTFCDCDIEIDKALISGRTCDQAYQAAIAKFDAAIEHYQRNGRFQTAAFLETDRDRLVAPSTDAAYGQKTAFLDTGAHP